MRSQGFWIIAWHIGSVVTFVVLMVEDWPRLNWWNWIIVAPINLFLGEIWPIYWGILRWVFPL
jgi:hypothetical protein